MIIPTRFQSIKLELRYFLKGDTIPTDEEEKPNKEEVAWLLYVHNKIEKMVEIYFLNHPNKRQGYGPYTIETSKTQVRLCIFKSLDIDDVEKTHIVNWKVE